MDTILPFSDAFWDLMLIVDSAPDTPDGSLDNLILEEGGWIEKRLVSWPASEGMFGSIVERQQGYQTYITPKTKKWLRDLNAISPKNLAQMLPDPVNWTNHFLQVAGSGDLQVYYKTWTSADEVGKKPHLPFKAALTQLDIIKSKGSEEQVEDLLKDPFSYHGFNSHTRLTPKGKHLLAELIELCGEAVLSEMFKYAAQREVQFCISNLRLLINPLRKLTVEDWLDKFRNFDKGVEKADWQGRSYIQHKWRSRFGLNLVLVGRELPAFKQAVSKLKPSDWEWLVAPEMNPLVLLVLSNMPEFVNVGKTAKDVLTEKHLIHCDEDHSRKLAMHWLPDAIDTLSCYGEGHLFEAAVETLPLSEAAILLVKANPSVRRIIAPKLKARLAQQDKDEKIDVC